MGPPGNRGSWGPCVLAQTQKAYEKGTRGISWGPLLTPGPSGSARVSKWSVCPWTCRNLEKPPVQRVSLLCIL
ncbi:unnamed protein product [Staurois parvus]|uniref:Uncharacterized protein n=1 Tax=Staurois parvus TaxID=386267 RepID=A0ABN9EX27_9NEOB|nr:unnamed protein product [Staurois parvus]